MARDALSIYKELREKNIQEGNLNALAVELRTYDLADLLSKVGALSCMPENASHATRLEALAAAAITNPYEPKKPKISKRQLQRIADRHLGLNSSITQLEDPCVNLFTESITFFDGAYIVFPGLLASAGFILRNICKGLFLGRESSQDEQFKSSVYREMMVLLLLSNELAQRANLGRGLYPSTITWDEHVRVPESRFLKRLQASVILSENELEQILSTNSIPTICLQPYLSTPGTQKLPDNDLDSSSIYAKPIVKVEDEYIVTVSGLLIHATLHRILSLAVESKAVSEFVESYRRATWDNVQSSLRLLGMSPSCPDVLLGSKERTQWLESCYQFDTDKLLCVQYFADDLRGYHVDKPFSEWVNTDIPRLVVERQAQILEQIYQNLPGISNVVWLILTQGYGRPFQFQLCLSDLKCPTIALSVADLEVLGLSERGDQLAIWKYLEHKTQVRKQRPVVSTSEIDEFEFYRSNMHSYPLPDDVRGVIVVRPGTGGHLIRRAYSRLDLHGVIGDQPHTVAEVISSTNATFPVSVISGLSHTIDRSAFVIERFSIPVWIVGPRYTEQLEHAELHSLYALLGDSIGFWLWQSKNYVGPLIDLLSSKIDRLTIETSLQVSDTWQQLPVDFKEPDPSGNIDEHISVETNRDEAKIKLKIRESIKTWLVTPDNRFERELMNLVFRGIRDLGRDIIDNTGLLPTNKNIREAVDLGIPQGMRKTTLVLPIQDPRFDPKMLPEVRLIQEADQIDVAKGIRRHLLSAPFRDGVIRSSESKTGLLNGIVDYLYMELTRAISCLETTGLLEFLLSQHEATVHRTLANHLRIPLQLGSLYDTQELIRKLQEETAEANHTSMALRFFIEYVSACPPHGWRPISYEVFDRLIALSAEIIILGAISDRIHHEMDDTSVEIRAGRLSIDQRDYYAAFKEFIPNYFVEVVGRSVKHFKDPWQRMSYSEPEQIQNGLDSDFDRAFLAEFGFSPRDYEATCGQMVVLGYEQDGPAKYMPREQLIAEIAKETGVPRHTISNVVDSITLKERDEYLKPPPGYRPWEVYPWKVNRSLSFVRKPLILVQRGEEEGVLWGNRHLVHTIEFLYNHCYSGKLRAKSSTMKKFISDIRNEDGKVFNDEVFEAFEKQRGITVRRRIDRFCGTEMVDAKGNLGDIDVLAVSDSTGSILTIECKNLNAAISPDEYKNELRSLYIDDDEEDSEATRLVRRAKWVQDNIELVSREIKVASRTRWKIQPLIVTSEELFTPYLQKTAVETIPLSRLIEEFLPNWIQSRAEPDSTTTSDT